MRSKATLASIMTIAFLALTACKPGGSSGPTADAATKSEVQQVIASVLEIEKSKVSMASPLQGDKLGADALQVAQIIHSAGEAFDIEIHDNDISSS